MPSARNERVGRELTRPVPIGQQGKASVAQTMASAGGAGTEASSRREQLLH